ncbi:ganglioside-induced differentiation-associated protein 1-like [Pollicipes pollicipes]|uniref:ganglioside-induced differentiation-associated protein 1-like n=1 Tax=Pollicipes pollicipes TaxID=41117 RepID=UPI001884AFA3|nr:ganglioside-induced differentiation-associated protein 1-like [Pollicipes pollicipes]
MNRNGNGVLKLYHFPMSFYSQRAVLTLHEKGLAFEEELVNIQANEQHRPEYLHINPKGTVPALQDGVKVIPDSTLIMEYLEDNFSDGKFPRLLPLDKSSEEYRKVTNFTEEFLKLDIPVFTYGTFHNEELRQKVRLPRMMLRSIVNKTRPAEGKNPLVLARVLHAMEEVPEAREVLQNKVDSMKKLADGMLDPEKHRQAMRGVDAFLQRAEDELVTHTGERASWWLCGASFSLADVDLCVLLNRIWMLGLEERLFTRTRPHLATYFRRARQRTAFQKTTAMPFKIRALLLAERVGSYLPLVLGLGAILAAAYGIYAARR